MADEDVLELILKTRVEGAEEIAKAARSLRSYARARKSAAEADTAAAKAKEQLGKAEQGSGGSGGNDGGGKGSRRRRSSSSGGDGSPEPSPGDGMPPPRSRRGSSYGSGPYERLDRLRAQYDMEQKSGAASPARLKDLQYNIGKTQSRIKDIETAEAMGPILEVAGEFALVVEAAKKLKEGLDSAAENARQSARDFSATKLITGGGFLGNADSARLMAYGQALGVKDLPSEAMSLHQNLMNGSPWARMYAMRLGLDVRPDPFGDPDWGGQYLKAIRGIRGMGDERQQIRAMRALGLGESSRSFMDVSDDTYDMMERSAHPRALLNNEFQRKRSLDNDVRDRLFDQSKTNFWEGVGQEWDNFKRMPLRRIKGWATDWMNQQAVNKSREVPTDEMDAQAARDAMDSMRKADRAYMTTKPGARSSRPEPMPTPRPEPRMPAKVIRIWGNRDEAAASADQMSVYRVPSMMRSGSAGFGGGNDSDTALMMLVATLTSLNKTISAVYGGGDRAASALPERIAGPYLVQAVNQRALHLGAL